MGKSLNEAVASNLRATIDCEVQSGVVPPFEYFAADRDGDIIFSHISGTRGLGSSEPLALDTIFWMASLTKLITTIACMQLVEQGYITLDDPEQVALVAPELSKFQVLHRCDGGGFQLEDQRKPITLRMLLNHTAGFGYAFDDPRLRDWSLPAGIDDFHADFSELLRHQLVNQPGEKWQYGVGLDWAGVILERLTKTTLDDYVQKHIVQPLGLKDITFVPTDSMKQRLAYMHQRQPDGILQRTEHINRRHLLAHTRKEAQAVFQMGGCGCFGRPDQYCQIIATLLNGGYNSKAGVRLLRQETVEVMFEDQIADKPIYTYKTWETAKPLLANSSPLFPPPKDANSEDDTMGWGLSFALTLRAGSTGRSAGTASWEGLPNLYWFADRQNGLGGIIAAQVLPYGDKPIVRLSEEIETAIYKAYSRPD
ncbi:beta-lactamase family protein [Exophiala viscosa]|uniref:Beta-lactamase family protein n=1 Tax=Exophiala viscosa TaxID=2486360 RepID=A0AAN6DQ30_9EURO|nr:beta-lactamase family protein [Exophiala viscosa]